MVVIVVVRWLRVSMEREPRTARPWEFARGDVRDVPEHEVRILHALVVVVDGWHAAGRPGDAFSCAAHCTPALHFLIGERPECAVVESAGSHEYASVVRLVEDPPLVGARAGRLVPSFAGDVRPPSRCRPSLERVVRRTSDVEVDPKWDVIHMLAADFLAGALDDDPRRELAVVVETQDVLIEVVVAIEVVARLQVEAVHDLAALDPVAGAA